jgi:ABC-type dipeptide/oligopeptide/nickel transport system permease subunit
MKHQLQMIFKSHNFVVGFVIFMTVFLTAILFPVFSSADPLEMVGGLFFKPGTYVSITDTIDSKVYEMNVDTQKNKIAKAATDEELALMLEWFEKAGSTVDVSGLTIGQDNESIVTTWLTNYDSDIRLEGTSAYRKSFSRLFTKIQNVLHSDGYEIAVEDVETEGGLKTVNSIRPRDFARVGEIANVIRFPLGTDNFGRDMVTELIHAIGTSLKIGFIAGSIATAIGLTLGLLSGYVGGMLDNIITFITNMFTVIPPSSSSS